jgi:signal transduction histidine kinase
VIVDASSSEVQHWQGEPVSRNLVERFAMNSLLSVSVLGENLKGRLFFLDKASPTSDDIILADVVAGQAAASMDHFYFLQRLQQLAVREERMRLANDLHDGVLQSLTATGLQLQAALQVLDANPAAVRVQLGALQDLIFQEQRDLRSFVDELKLTNLPSSETDFKVGQLLGELAKRLERQWGFHVELTVTGSDAQVQAAMGREIYRVVREALVNAARHSQGSMARAQVEVEDQQVSISVCDDGVGFPFRGRFDEAALTALGIGPSMLKSRIASLAGSLIIHSGESGARLEITLPLSKRGS